MLKYLLSLLLLFIFTGCIPKQENVQNFFQTDSATSIKKDYAYLIEKVALLKTKLDKRNANAFNQENAKAIYAMFEEYENNIHLKYGYRTLTSYKDYLQLAFSKDAVSNRNDFLVLGLYYQIYEAYDIKAGHKLTSFQYDSEKLENLYKNLQILKWKIKVNRDFNDNYLFLTWQNNWQIELEKRLKQGWKPTWEELQALEYIKSKKETMLGYSNFSYEVLLTQMINRVENSLKTLGITPEELALEAIKSVFIFL